MKSINWTWYGFISKPVGNQMSCRMHIEWQGKTSLLETNKMSVRKSTHNNLYHVSRLSESESYCVYELQIISALESVLQHNSILSWYVLFYSSTIAIFSGMSISRFTWQYFAHIEIHTQNPVYNRSFTRFLAHILFTLCHTHRRRSSRNKMSCPRIERKRDRVPFRYPSSQNYYKTTG